MLAPRGMTQFVNQFLYCVEGEMNHALITLKLRNGLTQPRTPLANGGVVGSKQNPAC